MIAFNRHFLKFNNLQFLMAATVHAENIDYPAENVIDVINCPAGIFRFPGILNYGFLVLHSHHLTPMFAYSKISVGG
jgi:hypothetical protein